MGTVGEVLDAEWEDGLMFACSALSLMLLLISSLMLSLVLVCSVLSLMFFLAHTDRLPLDANPMALASSSPLSPESLSALYFSTFSAMESGMSVSVSMSVLLPVFLKMSCGVSSSM